MWPDAYVAGFLPPRLFTVSVIALLSDTQSRRRLSGHDHEAK